MKTAKKFNSTIYGGIWPVNLLWDRSKLSMSFRLEHVYGIDPVNWLYDKLRI